MYGGKVHHLSNVLLVKPHPAGYLTGISWIQDLFSSCKRYCQQYFSDVDVMEA